MKPPILIYGPTASGKSELATSLAEQLDGEVVNADSMQVYSDLAVLTDRPTLSRQKNVLHHLFGHVDGSIRYSVGRWLEEVRDVIRKVQSRDKVAIIVGGTGLYFHALVSGLSDIPPSSENVIEDISDLVESEGLEGLYERLKAVDSESAIRIEKNDKQRLIRAYEVWLMTGVPFSEIREQKGRPTLSKDQWLGIALYPERAKLYDRIETRFEKMLPNGAIEEVEILSKRNLRADLPVMKAHGVPWIIGYLRGEMSRKEMLELVKRDTRRYAKRQFTWIGRQFPDWPRIPSLQIDKRINIVRSLYENVDQTAIVR